MKKLMYVVLSAILLGCTSAQRYVEGTSMSLGVYIPVDNTLYGTEICSYLSGCKVVTTTNNTMWVKREFAATNSYFGMIHTIEHSKTKVEVKK